MIAPVPLLNETVPCAVAPVCTLTTDRLEWGSSGSVSLARSWVVVMLKAVPDTGENESALATGASLTALILMVELADAVRSPPPVLPLS